MAVDKNLFLYDLAVVAIMKNEGPYLKEWLDYYLLAGVDHFYIYDNDSPDNQKEILQPYIDAGLVTYIFYPGKAQQMKAYNEAVQKFRFQCRYMSFVDGDEFFLPKSKPTITEVVDEILSDNSFAGGLEVNWFTFGSNFQKTADYSRGVLERFTRRAKEPANIVKSICNPRKISYMTTPHYAWFFGDIIEINEATIKFFPDNDYKITDKIIMHHYHTKSREEYALKNNRGDGVFGDNDKYVDKLFNSSDRNEEFDDSILKYRDARLAALTQMGGGTDVLKFFAAQKKVDYNRIFGALIQNLSPTFSKNIPVQFLEDKLETFLTCRAVATHLKNSVLNDITGSFLEEAALHAIYKTLSTNIQLANLELLLNELPNILPLNYPAVDCIRKSCIKLIPPIKDWVHNSITDPKKLWMWKKFTDLDYLLKMLQTFDAYDKI